jgi:flagellar motor switch protein FliM
LEKVLSQEEIDAMIRAARGGGLASMTGPTAEPWDARESGHLGKDQVRAISQPHEVFARNLTHSLGAYLRVGFGAALVSAEYLAFREFLGSLPEVTYLASFQLSPVGAVAILHLDHTIAFPIIDLLLGGEGTGKNPERDTTEIEDSILESVSKMICRELEAAWRVLRLTFLFEQKQRQVQVEKLLPPEEKTLALSFEITVQENRGTLTIAFPAVVSNALLRKLANENAYQRPRVTRESTEQLRMQLEKSVFPVHLDLDGLGVPMRQVLGLAAGDLLPLPFRIGDPARLRVAGRPMYAAFPVRTGDSRAARVSHPLSEDEAKGKASA